MPSGGSAYACGKCPDNGSTSYHTKRSLLHFFVVVAWKAFSKSILKVNQLCWPAAQTVLMTPGEDGKKKNNNLDLGRKKKIKWNNYSNFKNK
jgi:hypothetical protein